MAAKVGPRLPKNRPPNAPPVFHLLAKPTGAICNLNCKYCFFLTKELLYPNSCFRMGDDVLEMYIKQLFESQKGPEVNIAWQGGEPTLMGLRFFKRSIELVEKFRKPGQTVLHTIQTNGTKINADWAKFFKENHFLVGLSVDGPKAMHDTYRVNKSGGGTFNRVMKGWRHLKEQDVDVNILCTLHAANADHPLEVYHFFRDEMGVNHIQFIPIIERTTEETRALAEFGWHDGSGNQRSLYKQAGDQVTARSVQPDQFGRFLISIFDQWVQRDVGKVFIQLFDVALGSWLGLHSLCIFTPTCGNALALEHNGDLYSCDHFVEPDYFLGSIKKTHMIELVASEKQRKFGQDKQDTLPRYCQACDVRFACNGGCPKDRFIQTPDGEAGLNYLCPGFKNFFHHIDHPMQIMADLLRRGRYADEVMDILAKE